MPSQEEALLEEGSTDSELDEISEADEVSSSNSKEDEGKVEHKKSSKAIEKPKEQKKAKETAPSPAKAKEPKTESAKKEAKPAPPAPAKSMEETLVEPDIDALSENIDEAAMTEESMTVQLSSDNVVTEEISSLADKLKTAFKKGISRQMSKEIPNSHGHKPSFGKLESKSIN